MAAQLNDGVDPAGNIDGLESPLVAKAIILTWKYRLIGDSTPSLLVDYFASCAAKCIYLYEKYRNMYFNTFDFKIERSLANISTQIYNFCNLIMVYTREPIDVTEIMKSIDVYSQRCKRF